MDEASVNHKDQKVPVSCPQCGRAYRVSPDMTGARVRCAACKAVFQVPPPVALHAAPPPAPSRPPPASEPFPDGICSVCRTAAAGEIMTCPQCHAPHHQDCWDYNRGCGKYGCPAAPSTEKLTDLEIPSGYWGQEEKACPACHNGIQAAALRCRHCGTVFATARPQDGGEFHAHRTLEADLPAVRRTALWFLVFSVLPCTAILAAIIGGIWYACNRRLIAALPPQQAAIAKIALGVAILQTLIQIAVAVLHTVLG